MHLFGVGIDIVETAQIQESLDQFGDKFLARVFLPEEIAYAQSMPNAALHLAGRFAAKEALSKALGTGIGTRFGWKDLEINRMESGEPRAVLHGPAKQFAEEKKISQILISLSHTRHYAAANAVIMAEG